MKASDLHFEPSPERPQAVRASMLVTYTGRRSGSERWWIEFPSHFSDHLSMSGEPWMALLLPLAFSLGETLEVRLPVRDSFVLSLEEVMRIWSRWYPQFHPVPLKASPASETYLENNRRIGMFFSGGVDSTFSVLHHDVHETTRIDDLVFLRGFDARLGEGTALAEAQARVARTADRLGKGIVLLTTNVRDTRLREANWERLAHGPVLAAAGLMLEPVYSKLMVGSAWPADLDSPLGSHPAIYPHLSNRNTRITLYAPDVKRASKIAYLSKRPELIQDLRVCWESPGGGNCGRCSKCLQTMAALEVYGALQSTNAFPTSSLDHALLRSIFIGRKSYYLEDVRDQAIAQGRMDVAESLNAAIESSASLSRLIFMDGILAIYVRLRFNPHLRRITDPVRPALWRFLRRVIRFVSARTASEN